MRLVPLLGMLLSAAAVWAQNVDCIRVMGYSTVRSWYGGETKSKFEKHIADESKWELLFQPASIISRWADPKWAGWNGEVKSPCRKGSGDPDIIILSVANKTDDDRQIEKDTYTTLGHIYRHWKNVRVVILQPQIGGVDDKPCMRNGKVVRDSKNHPAIDRAIARIVAARKDVIAGLSLEVNSCGDWSDNVGHIKGSVQDAIGKKVADYYNTFFTSYQIPGAPPPSGGGDPDPVDPDPGNDPVVPPVDDGPSCGPQEWKSEAFERQTDDFVISCDVTISGGNFSQAIVALADKQGVAAWNDNACLVRFRDGIVDARNQDNYAVVERYPYAMKTIYRLKMEVGISSGTYTVGIKGPGDQDWISVAEDFMFRGDWASTGGLSCLAARTVDGGCVEVSNMRLGAEEAEPTPVAPASFETGPVHESVLSVRRGSGARTFDISCQIPRATDIDLAVHSITGACIKKIAHGMYPAGAHSMTWDGMCRGGGRPPAGSYLIRLRGNGQSITRMVHMAN